jgi:DNA-directed RNA polymerase sigma subunit (sigma70/sigma32)
MVRPDRSYPAGMSEDERLRSCLDAVDRLAPLTESEVRDLAGAIEPQREADDLAATAELVVARRDAARERLIEGNLRTVVVIAEQCRDQGVPLGALLEAGNLGLVRAVQDFDWRWPLGFPRRATTAIHGAFAAAVSDRE